MTPLAATEAERLEPCPFCGSTQVGCGGAVGSTMIQCSHCGAEGPLSENPSRAAIAWNRRASQQSAAQATAEPVPPGSWVYTENEFGKFYQQAGTGMIMAVEQWQNMQEVLAAPDRAPSTDSAAAPTRRAFDRSPLDAYADANITPGGGK